MKLEANEVLKIIFQIAKSMKYSPTFNERYLHHYFAHLLQEKYNLLNLRENTDAIGLHPEWPTYKKQTKLFFGRYKKKDGKYRPDDSGTAGFIDFTIGNYDAPNIGIEFSLKYGWSNEEIVYDFLKLLDKKNPFNVSISFNVIFRKEGLVRGKYLEDLEKHMNDAFKEAVNRFNERWDASREVYFIITEIGRNNNRQHWHYDRISGKFQKGLPAI